MAARETITVSITPELRAFIRAQLTSGRYGNASEVVRAALRMLERDEASVPRPSPSAASSEQAHNRV